MHRKDLWHLAQQQLAFHIFTQIIGKSIIKLTTRGCKQALVIISALMFILLFALSIISPVDLI